MSGVQHMHITVCRKLSLSIPFPDCSCIFIKQHKLVMQSRNTLESYYQVLINYNVGNPFMGFQVSRCNGNWI